MVGRELVHVECDSVEFIAANGEHTGQPGENPANRCDFDVVRDRPEFTRQLAGHRIGITEAGYGRDLLERVQIVSIGAEGDHRVTKRQEVFVLANVSSPRFGSIDLGK